MPLWTTHTTDETAMMASTAAPRKTRGEGRHYPSGNQSRPALFIGDGINDAPALATATVGLPFGHQSEVTTEAAGAVIMDTSLNVSMNCSPNRGACDALRFKAP